GELRLVPGLAVVERDFDFGYATVAREGHATDRDRLPELRLEVARWRVDPAHRDDRGNVAPGPLLPVALVILGDRLDPGDPLDVLHPEDPGDDQSQRETMLGGQRLAVHQVDQQRVRLERLTQWDRLGI